MTACNHRTLIFLGGSSTNMTFLIMIALHSMKFEPMERMLEALQQTNDGNCIRCQYYQFKGVFRPRDRRSSVEKALQWVINNCDTYNVASVNLSLGFNDNNLTSKTWFLSDKFAALKSNGVFVHASGNDFEYYAFPGIDYPAADPNVFSVGSTITSDRKVARAQYYRHRPYFLLQPAKRNL